MRQSLLKSQLIDVCFDLKFVKGLIALHLVLFSRVSGMETLFQSLPLPPGEVPLPRASSIARFASRSR
eukprot:8127325-Pyramimonas_sp.AAC.1